MFQATPLNIETVLLCGFLFFTIEKLCFLSVKTGRLQFLSQTPKQPQFLVGQWYRQGVGLEDSTLPRRCPQSPTPPLLALLPASHVTSDSTPREPTPHGLMLECVKRNQEKREDTGQEHSYGVLLYVVNSFIHCLNCSPV